MKNKHRVPKKQWAKWSAAGKHSFNTVYEDMVGNQETFSHPKSELRPLFQWRTTAWNAAWIAAGCVTNN